MNDYFTNTIFIAASNILAAAILAPTQDDCERLTRLSEIFVAMLSREQVSEVKEAATIIAGI